MDGAPARGPDHRSRDGARPGEGWDDFTRAIELFHSPTQNAFYADAEGRIGMAMAGRLPLRRAGDGSLPAPGWDGSHDWLGLLPAVENPRTPAATGAGFFAECQQPPGRRPVSPSRHRRLERRPAGPAHHRSARRGHLSRRAARRRRHAPSAERPAFDPGRGFPALARSRATSRRRDRRGARRHHGMGRLAMPDLPEPLVFQAWYRSLVRHVLADELGDGFAAFQGIRPEAMRHILEQAPGWCDDVTTPDRIESCGDMAAAALASAVDELGAAHGADWRDWRWGEASLAHFAHRPLDAAPVLGRLFSIVTGSGGGDAGTVHVARYAADTPYATVAAASLRMVADLTEAGTLHVVLPTGQSGHPLSRHFSDQTARWRNGELYTLKIALPPGGNRPELVLRP
ncbi:MAG: penicillin acylase family protein [Geminicoccaceae bacterium]